MSMNAQEERIGLGCRLLDTNLLLYPNDSRRVNMLALKQRLFAWHRESFYGTALDVQEGAPGKTEGIVLPEDMAVRFLAEGIQEAAVQLELSRELSALIKAAPVLLRCLEEGCYIPDFAAWQKGRPGWRIMPVEADARLWEEACLEAAAAGFGELVQQWPDRVLKLLLAADSRVQSAWEKLAGAYPLLAMGKDSSAGSHAPLDGGSAGAFFHDEEDWLIAVGWKRDEAPFRVALRLTEPGAADELGSVRDNWTLDTVLLDRDDASVRLIWQDWMERELLNAGEPGSEAAAAGVGGEAAAVRLEEAEAASALENGSVNPNAAGSPVKGRVNSPIPSSWLPYLRQRMAKERQRWLTAAPRLAWKNADGDGGVRQILQDQEVWDFLVEDSVKLAESGAAVLLPSWWEAVRKTKIKLKAKVRSSAGASQSIFGMDSILQFDWRIAVGDAQLTEEEFRRMAEQKKHLFQINGQWVLLNPAMLEQIRQVMKRLQKKKGLSFREAMELHLLGGSDIGGAADSGEAGNAAEASGDAAALRLEVELNEHLGHMAGHLQRVSSIPMADHPAGFRGELRKYQREGTSWLVFLQQFGLGGCLADDMGLGKTVQWIVYLLSLKEKGDLLSPALLICPTSVIGNWQMELERFSPDLKVHLHYGARRSKGDAFGAAVDGMDVVITSYNLAHLDEEELSAVEWSSLCLDEAQNIKNAYTKQAGAIRSLKARHRVALTGTPIENRLTELWSIFDYLNPGYLGTLGEFRRNFASEVEKGNPERTQMVQKLVRPFLLRRVKKDPAIQLDLPEKNEMKSYVPLSSEQGALYESIVQNMFEKVDRLSPMERRGLILATLTRLKQACDHPSLVVAGGGGTAGIGEGIKGGTAEQAASVTGKASGGEAAKDAGVAGGRSRRSKTAAGRTSAGSASSAKLARLLEMVDELRSEGDKCLIFTQFVEMGHILQAELARERDETVLFLHGGVPKAKRDEMIARFQNDGDAAIFVLSLKAGGTGLNLTAANHVFHFDRWWNPAVENQATDRAFRIGQTRDVQVHKFITMGTLEERIDQMMDKKMDLSRQIIGSGENWITELSTDELRELFSLRRQWMAD